MDTYIHTYIDKCTYGYKGRMTMNIITARILATVLQTKPGLAQVVFSVLVVESSFGGLGCPKGNINMSIIQTMVGRSRNHSSHNKWGWSRSG